MATASTPATGPLQAVACDLCNSSKDRTLLTLPDLMGKTSDQVYRVARCRRCDLIYLNPRPVAWSLPRYYPESYAPFRRNRLSSKARVWFHQRSVWELHRFLARPNRVLDIGCGTGELLDVIRAAGNNQIMGIEPSAQAAEIARRDRNLNVKTGTLEQVNLPSESIDTVLLSHVLEHLPSPRSTMSEVRRVLNPGGVVIIWVPNAASIPAQVLGRYWMGWDVPRHLYAFTPGSLHRLMAAVELEPGEILHERHGLEWSWGLRLWTEERYPSSRINGLLAILHPAISVAMTPVGVISAALGQSGRIRMIARKPLE